MAEGWLDRATDGWRPFKSVHILRAIVCECGYARTVTATDIFGQQMFCRSVAPGWPSIDILIRLCLSRAHRRIRLAFRRLPELITLTNKHTFIVRMRHKLTTHTSMWRRKCANVQRLRVNDEMERR